MAVSVKKVKPPKRPLHDPKMPQVVQAAQIAFGVMKAVGANSWPGVVEVAQRDVDIRTLVTLTDEQQAILDQNASILQYLIVKPATTVDACTTCGKHALSSGAAGSKKCTRTLHCPGTIVRAALVPKYAK